MTILNEISNHFQELESSSPLMVKQYCVSIIETLNYLKKSDQFQLVNKLEAFAEKNAFEKKHLLGYSKLIYAFHLLHQENYELALKKGTESYIIFLEIEDLEGAAISMGMQGTIYRSIGNFDLALKVLLISQEELKTTEYLQFRLLACKNDMGACYYELNDLESAYILFGEMLKISRNYHSFNCEVYAFFSVNYIHTLKNNSFYWEVYALHGLGKILLKQGDFTQAKGHFIKALEISEKNNHVKSTCNSFSELGIFYAASDQYDIAEDYHCRALILRQENELIGGAITSCIKLGEIYIKLSNLDKAVEVLNKGLTLAAKINVYLKTSRIHLLLSEIYESKKRLNKVIDHFKTYHDLFSKLTVEDNSRRIKNIKHFFESEQIRNENVIIKKQKELLEIEKEKSDYLLLNILPHEIAEELKLYGKTQAKHFESVTVMFTDFVGFTQISEKLLPTELVAEIDRCFKAFDEIIGRHSIEKIKTIGDSYMCASGLPVPNKTHAIGIINAALEIQQYMKMHLQQKKLSRKPTFELRIGIHTGPVVAGVVGFKKFAYDIWGDTVNIASRMESSGESGKINISGNTYELVKNEFNCFHRGKIMAKNKGEIDMYFVDALDQQNILSRNN